MGPSSVLPIQVEGIYTKALLDSGSQVTLLYRSFYEKHLKHLPLTPIENLEIWGLSSQRYPYDGCLSLKLEFPGSVAGVAESIDALVLVCPDPIMKGDVNILVGTNTAVVKKLVEICETKMGSDFLHTLTVHPEIRTAYEQVIAVSKCDVDDCRGTVWFPRLKPLKLTPGESVRVSGILKYPATTSAKPLLVDQPEESRFPEELLVRAEVQSATAVHSKRIGVTIRNVSSCPVTIKRGMPIAHVFPVDVVPAVSKPRESSGQIQLTKDSFHFGDTPVSEEWKQRLAKKMLERKDVFSCDEFDVGCSKSTQHHIRLTEDKPFRERSRRLAPADIEDVRQHLRKLKEAGIIADSRSPYASPIVVVRKKNGQIRMCVDYRTLNRRTIPDQYTVPRIEDALACLNGSQWFSVLDLRSGYYQIPLSEDDQEKTAFICPVGFYQFQRMPQGICGAPATFQRVMEKTVGDMNLLEVLVYLDDLIIFGRTLEEHEERLLKVLDRLQGEGLKLSLDKCTFCQTSVSYVGHIVSQDGVSTDPSKIEAVKSWPRPQNVTELRSFLGFCGYYRRFVKDYSKISYPLNQLLQGCLPNKSLKKIKAGDNPDRVVYKASDPFGSRWTDACEAAFNELKVRLTQAPVLVFANSQLPYVLHVDACCEGLGGVLYQDQGQGLRPVAFVSRSLTPSERNYPVHKLEFLALKWAVVDKLHDYLYGAKFEVQTDNNPLTYVLTTAKLDAAGHRWLAALSAYDFSLKYRPGRQNIDADALSRRPHREVNDQEWTNISSSGVRSLCKLPVQDMSNCFATASRIVMSLGGSVKSVPKAYCNLATLDTSVIPKLSSADLSRAQQEDPCLGEIWKALKGGDLSRVNRESHKDLPLIMREWERLVMENGVMFRCTQAPGKPRRKQLCLPRQFHDVVLRSLHDDSGHLGFDKTYGLVKERFYWPRMKMEVEKYCQTCARCVQRKTLPKRVAPLSHLSSEGPMDLVCMDFLSIEPDSKNIGNVLVITDHYTRYAQAFPTKDQKASTVAKVLWEKYFIHYGLPRRMHSDQGRDFESRLIQELFDLLGVEKSRTTPYHPQGDPQPERFNRTLLDMLGTLDPKQKPQWSRHIGHLVHVYNSSLNETTGYSPYFLMFGREARLPIDLSFGVSSDGTSTKSYQRYVKTMQQELRSVYELAEEKAGKKNAGNKRRYDQKLHYSYLVPGDRVLIRNLGLQGKHKLADRWSTELYIVQSQMPHLPVFRLKPESGTGPVKILHRNHILPIGQGLRQRQVPDSVPEPRKRVLRKRKNAGQTQSLEEEGENAPVRQEKEGRGDQNPDLSSESEDELYGVWYHVPENHPLTHRRRDPSQNNAEVFDNAVSETVKQIVSENVEQSGAQVEVSQRVETDESVESVSRLLPESDPDNLQSVSQLSDLGDVESDLSNVNESDINQGISAEEIEKERRSQRERTVPKRFTYDTLGEPNFEPVIAQTKAVSPVRYCSTLFLWMNVPARRLST